MTAQAARNDQMEGTMESYTKTIRIHAPAHKVYDAVTTVPGIKGWWSEDTSEHNGEYTIRFGGDNFQTMRLVGPVPDKRVTWEWIAQYFPVGGTTQTDEWVGTSVSFDIQANDDGTSALVFTHQGLTPHAVCYDMCTNGWNYYMESLRRYVEEGAGTPFSNAAR
jgi:uncharacterized protein YndB with AHSA1/START domain